MSAEEVAGFIAIPRLAELVPSGVERWSANAYRNPAQLAEGGVLVVGASATG